MSTGIRPISEVAQGLGIAPEHLIPYGDDKAKIRLAARDAATRPKGRLILVSAITPTDAGEGKTTISVGLAQGLATIGKNVCLALREPSLGPVFGLKGGATGGGRSRVVPEADINLHFTGDFHAISTANNLLAAMLDNHLHQGNALGIDVRKVLWRRVVDLNDRALRQVIVGLGGASEGVPRETGFDITPASEVMAALCLAADVEDLRTRLGRIVVALDGDDQPVTAADLKAVGAMMAVLKDAVQPNLVQTLEGVPTLLHGGPFGNIAHGCNSVIATTTALAHADWVVTEAGFGFDLGAEKFCDIKCRVAGLDPDAVVLVATVRALKRHGGVKKRNITVHDPAAVERGLANLEKQIENARTLLGTPVVALNRFAGDQDDEIDVVRTACERWGVPFAVADIFADGGPGGAALAERVVAQAETSPTSLSPVYPLDASIADKLDAVATRIYGARKVIWSRPARLARKRLERLGYGNLPLCVAKTHKSLSDIATKVGRPTDFDVTVRDVVLAAGAGFLVPLLGTIMRMPGLGAVPQAEHVDLRDGEVIGVA